eukprot:424535_1
MGSATSSNSVNQMSAKVILNGKSKRDIVKHLKKLYETEQPMFQLIRYGFHFVMDNQDATKMVKGAKITNGTVGTLGALGASEIGSIVGASIGILGGPAGIVTGYLMGGAIGGAAAGGLAYKAHKAEIKEFDIAAWHHYIVIEYGNKLKYKNDDGFIYEFFLRIDFSNEGYSITQDKTIEFWNIFEAEKEIKRGYLEKSVKCKGTIDTLIEAIKYTDSQYNVITNNCQDVSKQIWEKMTKSIFHSMINTHNIKKSKS